MTGSASTRCIERSVLLSATPEQVFNLLARPENMPQWFANEANWQADGRQNIEIRWHRHGKVIPDVLHNVQAEFAGETGTVAWDWEKAFPAFEASTNETTAVQAHIKPDSGGTRLVLRETGCGDGAAWDFAVRRHSLGWDVMLGRLAAVTGIIPTRVITGARMLPYGCAAAWYAISTGDMIGRWINEAQAWDSRQGGKWQMTATKGEIGHGWFTRVTPLTELSFSWSWYAADLAPTHCTLRLEETEDGTYASVLHHGWGYGEAWDSELNDCRNGWNACFTTLAGLGQELNQAAQPA